ncbi:MULTISPECIES: hypothetical protein [Streptomyces]|uniref:hypothetical protein n=1 Tax=Streptomyces TaxID=1883 RepID=UPI001587A42C|nr:hypothetical protein [Streptomyces sp. CAI-85]MBO7940141.1 hypothetical protein [Streptomyces sp. S9]NUV58284.1 hypothetical protein [Streptomyces sp. CAI-85]
MATPYTVVVYPPAADGGRRVRSGAHFLGMAYGLLDIAEFLRDAGVDDADETYVETSPRIEWRGGGPKAWDAEQTPG